MILGIGSLRPIGLHNLCKRSRGKIICSLQSEPGKSREGIKRRELLGVVPITCLCGSVCETAPRGGIHGWYNSYFAYAMANMMDGYEEQVATVKEGLFGRLFAQSNISDILEVGIGAGPNFRFYPAELIKGGLRVTGVDPNPAMNPYALESAERNGLAGSLTLLTGAAEQLPLPDNSMDAVIITLVLCSVKDTKASLAEVHRVLRPGGTYLFIEHVRAPPSEPLLQVSQKIFNPLQQLVADGCTLDRDTLSVINSSGFQRVEAEEFLLDKAAFLAPHIAGLAYV